MFNNFNRSAGDNLEAVLATWDICSQNRRAEPVQWLSSAILLLRKDTLSGNPRTGKLMLNEHICTYTSTKQRGNIFSSSVGGNAKTPSHVDTTILFRRMGYISPM
jgi:hypothetical protein